MRARSLVAVLAAALLMTHAARGDAPPSADSVASARAHYKRGVQLYEQGSYTEALVELRRANELAPTYRLLYNLALVQMRLGDWTGALHSLESYLDGGGAEIPAPRRTEVGQLLVESTAHVATLTISANVEGARIQLDDVLVGSTPLAASIRANPGPHKLVASKDGRTSVVKEIDLATGERLDLPLVLEEAPAPVAAAAPLPAPTESSPAALPPPPLPLPPPAPEGPPPPRPTPWIGWIVTGALAAGSLATGIAALAESHSLSNQLVQPTSGATLHSTHETTIDLALATDILGGAALVAGGVTLYITLAPPTPGGAPRGAQTLPLGASLTAHF